MPPPFGYPVSMAGIDKRAVRDQALELLEPEIEPLREAADKTWRAATLRRHPFKLHQGRRFR